MKIPPGLVAPLAGLLYRLWNTTLRMTQVNRAACEKHQRVILAFWHDELFIGPALLGDWHVLAIVSRSRDVEYMARLLESVGIRTARGSSSRGGVAALLHAAKYIKKNNCYGCVIVDGPRGPRHEVKDGVFFLSQYADAPIVPCRFFYSRAKVFGSWDKFQLPLPFSRATVVLGDPYYPAPGELTPEAREKERAVLKKKMDALTLDSYTV